MAIRLLLDSHISPRVARILGERGVDAVSLREWQGGSYLNASDEEILHAADQEVRSLVTFDVGAIPGRAQQFAESEIEHAGVILISEKTIKQDDIGTLLRSLERFAAQYEDVDLRNQVLYLAR